MVRQSHHVASVRLAYSPATPQTDDMFAVANARLVAAAVLTAGAQNSRHPAWGEYPLGAARGRDGYPISVLAQPRAGFNPISCAATVEQVLCFCRTAGTGPSGLAVVPGM